MELSFASGLIPFNDGQASCANGCVAKFGVKRGFPNFNQRIDMPLHRNFTYWIDKRKWKYIFLLSTLELSGIAQNSLAFPG